MAYQSFANLNYDKCALEKKEEENKNHFNWMVDPNYGQSNKSCFIASSPYSHTPAHFVPSKVIDIESNLRGQTLSLSRCPSQKYNPLANCTECEKCNEGLPCGCEHCIKNKQDTLKECEDATAKFLVPEYTRVKRPCNVLSGITINRFVPLCENVQDIKKISDNSYIGSNTRLDVRDTFASMNQKYKSQMI